MKDRKLEEKVFKSLNQLEKMRLAKESYARMKDDGFFKRLKTMSIPPQLVVDLLKRLQRYVFAAIIDLDQQPEPYLEHLNYAYEIHCDLDDNVMIGFISVFIAFAHQKLTNYPMMDEYFRIASENFQKANQPKLVENLKKARIGQPALLYWFDNYMKLIGFEKIVEEGLRGLQFDDELMKRINRKTNAKELTSEGAVCLLQGNYPKAIELNQQALKINKEAGDRAGMGLNYASLGNAYKLLGDFEKAREYMDNACDIERELGRRGELAENLTTLATIYEDMHQYEKSLVMNKEAFELFEQLNDSRGISMVLTHTGTTFGEMGYYKKALEMFKKSRGLSEGLNDEYGIANSYANEANILDKTHRHEEATPLYKKALQIFQKFGFKSNVASTYFNMGLNAANKRKFSDSVEYYEKALSLFKQLGNTTAAAKVKSNIDELRLIRPRK